MYNDNLDNADLNDQLNGIEHLEPLDQDDTHWIDDLI